MRGTLMTCAAVVLATAVATAASYTAFSNRLSQFDAQRHALAQELVQLRHEMAALKRDNSPRNAAAPSPQFASVAPPPGAQQLDADEVRDLVKAMVREERERSVIAMQKQTMRDWQSRRSGPYGQYNTRVNGMVEHLGLDGSQAQVYHELLKEYDGYAANLYQGLRQDLGNPPNWQAVEQQLEAIEEQRKGLDAQFDRAFLTTLSAEQAAAFVRLPADARGMGADAGLSALQVTAGDLREG